ncbi:MAG: sodium/glutamate symporter, partial [Thermomicrobiales bacterium]
MTPNDYGYALVALCLIFAAASMIRRRTPALRAYFIPVAVIAGFLMLGLGPEGLGRLTDNSGLFTESMVEVWQALPGLLVNVMCASMLLGERLPGPRMIWKISGPHAIFAGLSSFGQFAVGGVLVLVLLGPVFDVNDLAGALIEVAYGGGHGTVAGLSGAFAEEGADELVDLGFGLATIGLIAAVIMGTLLVNFAVRSPSIEIARDTPTDPDEDLDIDFHMPGPDDPPLDEDRGMTQVTAAAVALGVAIALAIVMLEVLRVLGDWAGTDVFANFPLFPFTIIGGVIVQLAAVQWHFEWAVNRRAIEGWGGISTDGLVACSIGTLSLSALGNNIAPLLVLAAGSTIWSLFILMGMGPRFFGKRWFEPAITEFGETQGNVATGFMMLDMVDPQRKTDAVYGYSYRQLITRPLIGG